MNDRVCYVYYLYNKKRKAVKIGVSINPESRLQHLQCACPDPLTYVHLVEFQSYDDAFRGEHILHRVFKNNVYRPRKNGRPSEWFNDKILTTLLSYFRTADDILKNADEQETLEMLSAKKEAANKMALRRKRIREKKPQKKTTYIKRMELIDGKLKWVRRKLA